MKASTVAGRVLDAMDLLDPEDLLELGDALAGGPLDRLAQRFRASAKYRTHFGRSSHSPTAAAAIARALLAVPADADLITAAGADPFWGTIAAAARDIGDADDDLDPRRTLLDPATQSLAYARAHRREIQP